MLDVICYVKSPLVDMSLITSSTMLMPAKKQQPRPKHVPQRMCVVCRQKTDKRRLTRLVYPVELGSLVIDPTGKRNGRGVYLCNQPACWDKAIQTATLAKSLDIELTLADKEYLAAHKPVAMDTHQTMLRKM